MSESIKNGSARALQYCISQKHLEALKDLASSEKDKIIMMPYETSALISSLTSMLNLKDKTQDIKDSKNERL